MWPQQNVTHILRQKRHTTAMELYMIQVYSQSMSKMDIFRILIRERIGDDENDDSL